MEIPSKTSIVRRFFPAYMYTLYWLFEPYWPMGFSVWLNAGQPNTPCFFLTETPGIEGCRLVLRVLHRALSKSGARCRGVA